MDFLDFSHLSGGLNNKRYTCNHVPLRQFAYESCDEDVKRFAKLSTDYYERQILFYVMSLILIKNAVTEVRD